MNDLEWRAVQNTLFTAFPSLWQWLNEACPTGKPNATLEFWREALDAFTADECIRVIREWATGKRKSFEAYQRDNVAVILASCVMFDRHQELRFEKPPATRRRNRRNDPGFGNVLSEIWKLGVQLRNGEIDQAAYERSVSEEALSIPVVDEIPETYRCLACCDRGMIRCYSNHDIRASWDVIQSEDAFAVGDMDMCACSCESGETSKARGMVVYSPTRFCVVKAIGQVEQQLEVRNWLRT